MTIELKNWITDMPAEGMWINLYRSGEEYAVFCRVTQPGWFIAVTGRHISENSSIPGNNDMWCEVPAPPDWDVIQDKRAAEAIVVRIEESKKRTIELEEASRVLADKMKGSSG